MARQSWHSLDYWRSLFSCSRADIFDVIESAMAVAAADHPHEFAARRDHVAETLFTCHKRKRSAAADHDNDGEETSSSEEEEDVSIGTISPYRSGEASSLLTDAESEDQIYHARTITPVRSYLAAAEEKEEEEEEEVAMKAKLQAARPRLNESYQVFAASKERRRVILLDSRDLLKIVGGGKVHKRAKHNLQWISPSLVRLIMNRKNNSI